jgi:hypothetical protein
LNFFKIVFFSLALFLVVILIIVVVLVFTLALRLRLAALGALLLFAALRAFIVLLGRILFLILFGLILCDSSCVKLRLFARSIILQVGYLGRKLNNIFLVDGEV